MDLKLHFIEGLGVRSVFSEHDWIKIWDKRRVMSESHPTFVSAFFISFINQIGKVANHLNPSHSLLILFF